MPSIKELLRADSQPFDEADFDEEFDEEFDSSLDEEFERELAERFKDDDWILALKQG